MGELETEFLAQLALALPVVVGVIGGAIGLVFTIAVSRLIFNRIRGTVK